MPDKKEENRPEHKRGFFSSSNNQLRRHLAQNPVARVIEIVVLIAVLIVVGVALFGMAVPTDRLLEALYQVHEAEILLIILLVSVVEMVFLASTIAGGMSLGQMLKHILTVVSLLALLFVVNESLYQWKVLPKLKTISSIGTLEDKSCVQGDRAHVHLQVRLIDTPVFLHVKSPEGDDYLQKDVLSPPTNQFKAQLVGEVQLGEGSLGAGKRYKISARTYSRPVTIFGHALPGMSSSEVRSPEIMVERCSLSDQSSSIEKPSK
ncbi:MAG: hypothetical protein ACLQPD_04395 [Desulfomonilaceae bacterium]